MIGFKEKPVSQYEVSMGIYMVSKRVLKFIPKDRVYGFDNLMLDLIASETKPVINKYSGYWLDIGRPDDYDVAIDIFEENRKRFLGG